MNNTNKNFIKITGIKCDNPKCNFSEDGIPMEDYEEWLDRECPDCGKNLLTEEDLNTVKMMYAMVAIANQLGTSDDDQVITTKVEMDGSGSVEFTDIKVK